MNRLGSGLKRQEQQIRDAFGRFNEHRNEELVSIEVGGRIIQEKRGLFTRLKGSLIADIFEARSVSLPGSAVKFKKLIGFLKGDTSKLPENESLAEQIEEQLENYGLMHLLIDKLKASNKVQDKRDEGAADKKEAPA